ncbi:uncharacterized protein KZ484_010919 [Pholidichthys leucotaenia]
MLLPVSCSNGSRIQNLRQSPVLWTAEVDQYRESADVDLRSEMEPRREDVPQQNDFNQEEVLVEQQLLHQKRNFIVVQVGADCSQIKEEQEDVCISQEGEQFGLKQETQTFDKDAPQLHDCKEEEVLTFQQLCNQERSSSLDQEEQDAAQDNGKSESEPKSEQFLSHSSPYTESQDQGAVL